MSDMERVVARDDIGYPIEARWKEGVPHFPLVLELEHDGHVIYLPPEQVRGMAIQLLLMMEGK